MAQGSKFNVHAIVFVRLNRYKSFTTKLFFSSFIYLRQCFYLCKSWMTHPMLLITICTTKIFTIHYLIAPLMFSLTYVCHHVEPSH